MDIATFSLLRFFLQILQNMPQANELYSNIFEKN